MARGRRGERENVTREREREKEEGNERESHEREGVSELNGVRVLANQFKDLQPVYMH